VASPIITKQIITEQSAEFLLTTEGRALLASASALLADQKDTLTALTRLRKAATPAMALAAWEMAELRKRGTAKFGEPASQLYFVREALEQASGLRIAEYHAERFRAVGNIQTISDLGGGIGGDALAFARAGFTVTLYERDSIRARFAAENARVCGFEKQITVIPSDATSAHLETDAAWLDPARRVGSRRVSDPEEYAPPLSWLHELSRGGLTAIGVKLSPAIDHALAVPFGAELQFLSEGGECREALLWLGAARSGQSLSATLIGNSGVQTLSGTADVPGDWKAPTDSRYLYEPDPAVIRAHLVGTLGVQISAQTVDPQIAYLLGDTLVSTPFAEAYEVLERFPYNKKHLQNALTARDVGRVIIKKRGFPLEPEAVRQSLKLRGSAEMIIVLARLSAGHEVFLCQRVSPGAA
jgi:hypothetical protein